MRVKFTYSSRHTRTADAHNKHRQSYPELAKEVIAAADVVLEILDARFIKDTRNLTMENYALEHGKLLIYVVNKVDLVNRKELEASAEFLELNPRVVLSCTTHQGRGLLRDRIKIEAKRFAKKAAAEDKSNLNMTLKDPTERRESRFEGDEIGEDDKLQIHRHGVGYRTFLKTGNEVHVGIIGYPNVGKSSIINMLTGRGAARTSPRAGFTRGIQKVKLSDGLLLLDTPGVMSDEDAAESQAKHLKKHAIIGVRTYDSTRHPEFIIAEIMQEHPGLFEEHYDIDAEGDSEILLETLGRKRNLLLKGGAIDIDRAARVALKEWQAGAVWKSKGKHAKKDAKKE
ncbi:MAG: GTPase [Candidatus Pacearchaeota archaeon]